MADGKAPYHGLAREQVVPLILIGLLVILSLWLAWNRIYQVDEAQNAYTAWLLGAGLSREFYVGVPVFLAPFAWLSRLAGSAETIFVQIRLGFCLLFWVNLALIVKSAGLRLRSRAGLWALAGAALLPPLWTYGLEARHENWILCGLLVMWMVGRHHSAKPWAYPVLGLTACLVQLGAFKAFVYWAPISLVFLLFPPPGTGRSRAQLALAWLAGVAAGCLIGLAVHLSLGTLGGYLADQANLSQVTSKVIRFGPWSALLRLLTQAPLLLAALVVPGLSLVIAAIRTGRTAWTWEGPLPEILLWAWTCLVLLVNPNPFPYNLVSIAACGALAIVTILRYPSLEEILTLPANRNLLLGLLIFVQGVPFVVQAGRLLDASNARQVQLMAWVEQLTDAAKDTVFDAAGLVPTRRSPTREWFVNLTNAESFRKGSGGLRQAIDQDAPAVIIPTYRFSYLDRRDIEAVQANYVGLASDLWVLGAEIKPGSQTWICRHPGRYAIAFEGVLKPGAWIKVDGRPAGIGAYEFQSGTHTLEASPEFKAVVEWMGPRLDAPLKVAGEGAMPGVFPIPNAF